ncbi:MAG: hypothetical protein JWP66_268 [Naasia sp.]|nr:hypothetical protein [Naasia sp.]
MSALGLLREAPVQPDGDEARDWLIDELTKRPYQEARPTWFDLLAQAIGEWIDDILSRLGDGSGPTFLIVVVLILAAILVIAFLLFGRPRLNRRRRAAADALFGHDDGRSAEQLRGSAERAAAAGDWTTAIVELFRVLARGLADRTLVDFYPGMTARGFARAAAVAFPGSRAELTASAETFDDVRYLGRPGTAEQYERLAALERSLRAARPELAATR